MKLARTPRELLESVTQADLVEMMAFERLEPFGALAEEYRLGQIAATLANIHRSKDQDAFQAPDFMPALRRAMDGYKPPPQIEELDPEALSALIDAQIFGHTIH